MKKVLLGLLIGLVVCLCIFAVLYKTNVISFGSGKEIINDCDLNCEVETSINDIIDLQNINESIANYTYTNYDQKNYTRIYGDELNTIINSLTSKIYGINNEVKNQAIKFADNKSFNILSCESAEYLIEKAYKNENRVYILYVSNTLDNGVLDSVLLGQMEIDLSNNKIIFDSQEYIPVKENELNLCSR